MSAGSARSANGRCYKRARGSQCSRQRKRLKYSDEEFKILEIPLKSPVDRKTYRLIELSNGLRALLISNPCRVTSDPDWVRTHPAQAYEFTVFNQSPQYISEVQPDNVSVNLNPLFDFGKPVRAEKYFVSLMLNSGSFKDPKEFPGLAHLCEHLVLHGSKKFPEEDAYRTYINEHDGYTNACTDRTLTNYHFQMKWSPGTFPTALEMFADMLINPLFKIDAIRREIESVDTEFFLRRNNHCMRREHLLGLVTTKKDDHSLKQFLMGQKSIFLPCNSPDGISRLRNAMKKLHQEEYRGNNMSLVVQGPDRLDCLQDWVIHSFKDVPPGLCKFNSDSVSKSQTGTPFDTDEFRKCYTVKPVEDKNELMITWALSPELWQNNEAVLQYLADILLDESPGGLPYFLRSKHWVVQVIAGCHRSSFSRNEYASLFQIFLYLTEKGRDSLNEVVMSVFSFLKLLGSSDFPHKQIFEEQKRIAKTKFNWMRPGNSLKYVRQLSSSMRFCSPRDILTGNSINVKYNENVILAIIKLLSPRTCNFMLFSDDIGQHQFDQTENVYGTQYMTQDIDAKVLKSWERVKIYKEFTIPEPNPYLSTRLKVPDMRGHRKSRIVSNAKLDLTYTPCHGIITPQVNYSLTLNSAAAYNWNPQEKGMMDIWLALLKLASLPYTAAPKAVGTQVFFEADANESNMQISVTGFNYKLVHLMTQIIDTFEYFEQEVSTESFKMAKDFILKSYYNMCIEPDFLACELVQRLKYLEKPLSAEIREVIQDLTFEEFLNFTKDFKKYMNIEANVTGAVGKHTVGLFKNRLQALNYLPPTPAAVYIKNITRKIVPLGERCIRVRAILADKKISVVHNYYQLCVTDFENIQICGLFAKMMQQPLFHQLRTKEQLGYIAYGALNYDSAYIGYSIVVASHSDKYSTCYVNRRIDCFLKTFYKNVLFGEEFNMTFLSENLIVRSVEYMRDFYKMYFLNEADSYFRKLSVQVVPGAMQTCICKGADGCRKSKWLLPANLNIAEKIPKLIFATASDDSKTRHWFWKKTRNGADEAYFISDILAYHFTH